MTTKSWAPAGAWTIYEAGGNWAQVRSLAACEGNVELDLAGVTDMDTTGVQLLLMMRRLCQQQGHDLRVIGCSEAVREAMRLYRYGRDPATGEFGEGDCP